MKQIASPGSMHETGCSGLVHWDDPEGWDGEGSRRGFQDGEHVHPWLIHVNVWQKQTKKTEYLPVNLLEIVILIFPSLPFKFTGLEIRNV